MKKTKYTSRMVSLLGYAIIGLGGVLFIQYHIMKFFHNPYPYSPVFVLVDTAILLIGAVAVIVSKCLQNIEEQLEKMENITPEKKKSE